MDFGVPSTVGNKEQLAKVLAEQLHAETDATKDRSSVCVWDTFEDPLVCAFVRVHR